MSGMQTQERSCTAFPGMRRYSMSARGRPTVIGWLRPARTERSGFGTLSKKNLLRILTDTMGACAHWPGAATARGSPRPASTRRSRSGMWPPDKTCSRSIATRRMSIVSIGTPAAPTSPVADRSRCSMSGKQRPARCCTPSTPPPAATSTWSPGLPMEHKSPRLRTTKASGFSTPKPVTKSSDFL